MFDWEKERGHTSISGKGTHLHRWKGDTPPSVERGHTSIIGKGTHLLWRNVPDGMSPVESPRWNVPDGMSPTLAALGLVDNLRLFDLYCYLRYKATGAHIVILIYHRVGEKDDSLFSTPLSPRAFDKQMRYLVRNFEVVSLENLARGLKECHLPANNKLAAITFDDGYEDNYTNAYPILKKYYLPATIFLTTGFIGTDKLFWWDEVSYMLAVTELRVLEMPGLGEFDLSSTGNRRQAAAVIKEKLKRCTEMEKKRLISALSETLKVYQKECSGNGRILSWSQIKEMSANGVDFGAHGNTHGILTNMPLVEAKKEIVDSKKIIEEQLSKPVSCFAYPNGDYNNEIATFVHGSGFTCAVTTQNKIINPKHNHSVYELPRINGTIENLSKFKAVFSGLYLDVIHRRLSMR